MQILRLCTNIPCHISDISFPTQMSQQYDAIIGKWSTRRFRPVLPGNLCRRIFSISNYNVYKIAFNRTPTCNSLLCMVDVTRILCGLSTTTDEKYPFEDYFIPANAFRPPYYSTAQSTERKDTKPCPPFASHHLCPTLKLSRMV